MITSDRERIEALTASGGWFNKTLHGSLREHAAERPDKLAVKDQPNREELTGDKPLELSWAELEIASDNLAQQLSDNGVGEDDPVVVQLPNVSELLVTYYAISQIGAIISPVPVQYGSHELNLLAGALNAKHVITLNRLRISN